MIFLNQASQGSKIYLFTLEGWHCEKTIHVHQGFKCIWDLEKNSIAMSNLTDNYKKKMLEHDKPLQMSLQNTFTGLVTNFLLNPVTSFGEKGTYILTAFTEPFQRPVLNLSCCICVFVILCHPSENNEIKYQSLNHRICLY